MLRKDEIVTVIPGTPEQAYRAASETCVGQPPPGEGGIDDLPTDPGTPPTGYIPPDGTPIILEDGNDDGSYTSYTGVAPAPSGFVCRLETTMVVDYSDPSHPATYYYVTCTRD